MFRLNEGIWCSESMPIFTPDFWFVFHVPKWKKKINVIPQATTRTLVAWHPWLYSNANKVSAEEKKTGNKYLGMLFTFATAVVDGDHEVVIHSVWIAAQVHPLVIYEWGGISLRTIFSYSRLTFICMRKWKWYMAFVTVSISIIHSVFGGNRKTHKLTMCKRLQDTRDEWLNKCMRMLYIIMCMFSIDIRKSTPAVVRLDAIAQTRTLYAHFGNHR